MARKKKSTTPDPQSEPASASETALPVDADAPAPEAPPREWVMHKMSSEEKTKFVRDWIGNAIFSDRHVGKADASSILPMIFMPLAFGALAGAPPEYLDDIGLVYEYYGKDQASRSINGYPMFMSVRFMSKADWESCVKVIIAEEERMKALHVE